MRHAAFVLAIVLTLMSGFVLRQIWTMEPAGSLPIQAAAGPPVEETAVAFYHAVNAYLDGGDDAELRQLLHPAFVTHQSGSSWDGTGDDLLRHLDSVRLHYPGIELEAEPVSVSSNTASVALSVKSAERGEFAGIEIDPVDLFGRLDIVRIERDLVIEHWSSAPVAGQMANYAALSIELPFASNTLDARVQQVGLESASDSILNYFRHLVLIIESGEARLDVLSHSTAPPMLWSAGRGQVAATPVEPETTVSLGPMDALYLPAGTNFRIWSAGSEDTRMIALDFGPQLFRAIPSESLLAEELDEALSSGVELEGAGERLTLSFGSAAMLPQSTLSSHEVQGLELAWITDGSLEMTGSGGEMRVRKAGGTRSQLIDGYALLQTGEAAAAGPGSDIIYQVSGDTPATAWFFSLVPAPVPANPDGTNATPAGPAPTPTRNPTLS